MTGAPAVVVRPLRFSDRIPAMRAFLEVLGLRPRIESRGGAWVDLVGAAGMVALHTAETSTSGAVDGETRLSFEVADAHAFGARLGDAGYDAALYDEAYGRVVEVTDPLGATMMIDERSDDLYGFVRHEPANTGVVPPVVVPVRFTDDAEGYHAFLTACGLTGTPAPGGYATYDSGGHGLVGVHYVYGDDLPVVGDGAACHLTLLTEEDLTAVEARLEVAGHRYERFDEDFGSFLDITDPDGQSVQVHTAPPSS